METRSCGLLASLKQQRIYYSFFQACPVFTSSVCQTLHSHMNSPDFAPLTPAGTALFCYLVAPELKEKWTICLKSEGEGPDISFLFHGNLLLHQACTSLVFLRFKSPCKHSCSIPFHLLLPSPQSDFLC